MHVLHPFLIWRGAAEELEKPDFWAAYDISRIVSSASMLDVRNAALGLCQQPPETWVPSDHLPIPQSGAAPQASLVIDRPVPLDEPPAEPAPNERHSRGTTPSPSAPAQHKVSLADMVATSVALRSGLDFEIVDAPSSWTYSLFPQAGTRSPSRAEGVEARVGQQSDSGAPRRPPPRPAATAKV